MKRFVSSLAVGLTLTVHIAAAAPLETEQLRPASQGVLTVAVFGDWPYNDLLLANSKLLVNSINADRSVEAVIHVGDIHSGSQPCTSAGILPRWRRPIPAGTRRCFQVFQQIWSPFIYTPGDNEWTDCHKAKQFASGDPLKEIVAVRGLFFSRPGVTLGLNEKDVLSQAQHFDPLHPDDAQYVENVMWQQSGVVFVTLNLPGSNNDMAPWTGSFANPAAQAQEVATRTAADIRWLEKAFDLAGTSRARAVVILQQADMWDPAQLASGGDGLTGYTPYVRRLADLVVQFDRPVLLFNGDSHLYEADQPLADPNSATGVIHGTQAVLNLTRITVQGSTNAPAEWLRLTIDTRRNPATFGWVNVPYCRDPLTSCQ